MIHQEKVAAVAAGLLVAEQHPRDNILPLQVTALALDVKWHEVQKRLAGMRGETLDLPAFVVASEQRRR